MPEEPKDLRPNHQEAPKQYIERCHCGNDRSHHMVSPVHTYTTWGQFWVALMGVSAHPIRVDFQCRVCKENFDFTTDPKELKQFL